MKCTLGTLILPFSMKCLFSQNQIPVFPKPNFAWRQHQICSFFVAFANCNSSTCSQKLHQKLDLLLAKCPKTGAMAAAFLTGNLICQTYYNFAVCNSTYALIKWLMQFWHFILLQQISIWVFSKPQFPNSKINLIVAANRILPMQIRLRGGGGVVADAIFIDLAR